MLFINNENHVIIMRTDKAERDEGKLVLYPGANEVASSKWELFKDHPGVKSYFDVGEVEIREKGYESLKSMTVREAIDLAKITVQKPLLEKMAKHEDRKAVKDAIAAQLAELEAK